LIAGTLISARSLNHGRSPVFISQFIAGGAVFSEVALEGGMQTAAHGVALAMGDVILIARSIVFASRNRDAQKPLGCSAASPTASVLISSWNVVVPFRPGNACRILARSIRREPAGD